MSIKPSNGLFMSVPDDVIQKLQAHLSPLNAWSLTGQSYTQGEGGEALPYMGHIGMSCCEGYGFQAVYSSIGYINQSVWV